MRFGKRFSPNFALTKKSPVIESVSYKVGRQYTGWPSQHVYEKTMRLVKRFDQNFWLTYEKELLFDFKQSDVRFGSEIIVITMPEARTNFSSVPIRFIDGKLVQVVISAYRVQTSGTNGTSSGGVEELRSCGVYASKCGSSTQLNLLTSANLNLDNEGDLEKERKCDKRKQEKKRQS